MERDSRAGELLDPVSTMDPLYKAAQGDRHWVDDCSESGWIAPAASFRGESQDACVMPV